MSRRFEITGIDGSVSMAVGDSIRIHLDTEKSSSSSPGYSGCLEIYFKDEPCPSAIYAANTWKSIRRLTPGDASNVGLSTEVCACGHARMDHEPFPDGQCRRFCEPCADGFVLHKVYTERLEQYITEQARMDNDVETVRVNARPQPGGSL